jgi:hypothetical protein
MKPKAIPREKRLAIQKFVAEHEDCRVIFGPTWRAWSVIVIGLDVRTNEQLLIGRPRTQEAANNLLSSASRMVSALERGKAVEREKRRNGK